MAEKDRDANERLDEAERRAAKTDATLRETARDLASNAETLEYRQTELKRTASIVNDVTKTARQLDEEMAETREAAKDLKKTP